MKEVAFFTNCYEQDWRELLLTGRLKEIISRMKTKFAFRGLIINNVKDRKAVEVAALSVLRNGIIDAYYFSEDFDCEVLQCFRIDRKSFKLDFYDGYWYSMGPLTAIYLCSCKWLVYCTCDCMVNNSSYSTSWIFDAIDLMQGDQSILVANPIWDYIDQSHLLFNYSELNEWKYDFGFTDQLFLVETSRVRLPIYGHYHPDCDNFPVYGGNPFERRLFGYLKSFGFKRLINSSVSYNHQKITTRQKSNIEFRVRFRRRISVYSRKINRRFRMFVWYINNYFKK